VIGDQVVKLVRTSLVTCGVAGAVVGFAGLYARPATARTTSAISPDPARVHYRFAIAGADSRAEITGRIAALDKRVASESKSPFDLEELAQQYLRRAQLDEDRRDYEIAETMARRSLDVLRTPNPALLTLAKLATVRHDFRTAIALTTEHMAQRRTAGAYIILATAHLALGELTTAAKDCDAALAIKPDGGSYLTRALVRQAQGRDVDAAADFAHAAALEEPGDPHGAARSRALWARFLLRRGDYAGTKLVLDEALRIVPGLPLAVAFSGELALRTGDPEAAGRLFERAFASSRQVRYLIDEARAEELAGDLAGADTLREQVETIVRGELGEGGLGHRLDLVEVLVDRISATLRVAARPGEAGAFDRGAKLDEAIGLAQTELARRPSADVRFQLARALACAGRTDEAWAQIDAALATGAREAQLFELAARLERTRGHDAEADRYTHEAERLDPGDHGWRELGLP
jgi:tetratricopeptide (TPR) repeat protein